MHRISQLIWHKRNIQGRPWKSLEFKKVTKSMKEKLEENLPILWDTRDIIMIKQGVFNTSRGGHI